MNMKMSMKSRSLRPQLFVAFSLMSVIPILALLSFIFPSLLPRHHFGVIVGAVVLLAGLGFFLVKSIIDSIIKINAEVRSIASGEVSREIRVSRDDELGELSMALNHLASNIKHSMDELKIYGDRTKDINVRIDQQLMALSGLLEISNLMTRNAELKEIFEVAVNRIIQVANASFAFLLLKAADAFEVGAQHGLKPHVVTSLKLSSNMYLLNQAMRVSGPVVVDAASDPDPSQDMLKLLDASRVVVFPVLVQGEAKGLLGFGSYANGPQLVYGSENSELLGIFGKQLSIAVENSFLAYKVQELETRDTVTGLFNKRYIVNRLDEEILRAISHQRPCALATVRVQNWASIRGALGLAGTSDVLKAMADVLRINVRSFDRVGRTDDAEFGVVMPEKNKRQAEEFANQILDHLSAMFRGRAEIERPRFWVGVAENPIDGMDAASLLQKIRTLSQQETA